ncbi:peptidoglycan-binding domain-containing protein, partial [Chryseobacterium echinoideorum]|uniref:peptidoglycan-binding domain-containing protein n=1 Tax=Chryseobacterium echinoideorum TaxID=1549648 RepID=UPI00162842EB
RTTNIASDEVKLYAKAKLIGFNTSLTDVTEKKDTQKHLTVNNEEEVYRAIIGDKDGRARHNPVDYDIISWVYANTTYPKDTKLKVKIFEDINWSIDPDCKELEVTEAVKEDGTLVAEINWGKLKDAKQNKKTKKYYAVIYDKDDNKLLDGSKSTTICSTVLMPQSELQKQASYAGAVIVGSENINTGGNNCGGKFCIKKGSPKSELIREINIRLAGFGGNVPTDEFTDRTEKMIKQFQRDYMKVPETGKICGNVLKAIDEFQAKYPINFDEIKCKCGSCTGYGKERNSEEYQNTKILEKHRKYEYPGVHRSLLWCYRASQFYINKDTQLNFKTKWVESGYRCHDHYIYKRDKTTNHCGKALDIHYNILSTGQRTKNNDDMNKIRKDIFMKYTGAKQDWNSGKDIFYLESFATTWIHVDVREFSQEYLTKKYFVKNLSELNGKSIVQLANELGFKDMCSCGGGFSSDNSNNSNNGGKNKYKWAHSEFGNILAQEESGDDYNICNKTKGGLEIIRNVKITELTVKEIQQKQKDRDIFAIGRYQLIPDTFNSAIASLGLDSNQKMDKETQDKIFDEYLIKVKRPKIIAYLEGGGTVEDAMYSSALEWASVGVEKGKRISDKVKKDKNGKVISRTERYAHGGESYYAGDGLNKSHITPEQIKNALINSKNANK